MRHRFRCARSTAGITGFFPSRALRRTFIMSEVRLWRVQCAAGCDRSGASSLVRRASTPIEIVRSVLLLNHFIQGRRRVCWRRNCRHLTSSGVPPFWCTGVALAGVLVRSDDVCRSCTSKPSSACATAAMDGAGDKSVRRVVTRNRNQCRLKSGCFTCSVDRSQLVHQAASSGHVVIQTWQHHSEG